MNYKISNYVVFENDPISQDGVILISTRDEYQIPVRVSKDDFEKIRFADTQFINTELFNECTKRKILVQSDECELEKIIEENNSRLLEINELSRTVMPSANCPHGCNMIAFGNYCGQNHTNNFITESILEQITTEINSQLTSRKYNSFILNFFGGEPLLKPKLILSMLEKYKSFCDINGIIFKSQIITSGFLAECQLIENLYKLGLTKLELTLDGTKSYHDKRRPLKNGKGTFDTIYNNLLALCQSSALANLNITVRMNVDDRNEEAVLSLFDELNRDNILSKAKFYIAHIRNWGDKESGNKYLDKEKFAALELKLMIRARDLGIQVQFLPYRKKILCSVVDEHSKIFDPYGNEHKCSETPLTILKKKLPDCFPNDNTWTDGWHTMLKENMVPCTSCKMLPVCGGACPKDWIQNDIPCPPFKFNFQQRLVHYFWRSNKKMDFTK